MHWSHSLKMDKHGLINRSCSVLAEGVPRAGTGSEPAVKALFRGWTRASIMAKV